MDDETIITNSSEETEEFGKNFAKRLHPGDVICLVGELGAGKTTFVKGLAKGLGVTTRIMSPTYVVVREHTIELGSTNREFRIQKLYHLDLYRLTSEKDVLGIDIHTLLNDKHAVTVIEWPEIAKSIFPPHTWKITFQPINEDARKITIEPFSS